MTAPASSELIYTESEGSFHHINPETGETWCRRGGERESLVPQSVHEHDGAAELWTHVEVMMRSPTEPALNDSLWSSWDPVDDSRPQGDDHAVVLSSQGPSFQNRDLTVTTPLSCDEVTHQVAEEHQPEQLDGGNGVEGDINSLPHFDSRSTPRLSLGDTRSQREGDSCLVDLSAVNELQSLNRVLQAQLEEVSRLCVIYMCSGENTRNELEDLRRALVVIGQHDFVLNADERLLEFTSDRVLTPPPSPPRQQQQQQGFATMFLGMGRLLGESSVWRCFQSSVFDVGSDSKFTGEESGIEDEWSRNLSAAKHHARNGRAQEAVEVLLLSITSNSFNGWGSLLVEGEKWNRLHGVGRQLWNDLVASKLTEYLCKHGDRLNVCTRVSSGMDGPVNANEQGHRVGQESSLSPELIVPFIEEIASEYVREKHRYEVSPQMAVNIGLPEQRQGCSHRHLVLEGILERLLVASISSFPDSAALFYKLASLRALQGRREAAHALMTEAMCMDPSYVLLNGGTHHR